MKTAVFDCMVFLQAATNSNGPARACLELVETGHIRLLVSPEILQEVEEVLRRPKIRAAFPQLSDEHVADFIARVKELVILQEETPLVFHLPRDPDDEPYINLAIETAPASLVSRDKDLLSLMDDDDFRRRYPDLTILSPAAFLQQVRTALAAPPRDG